MMVQAAKLMVKHITLPIVAGLSAWTVLAVWIGPFAKPLDVIIWLAVFLGVPDLGTSVEVGARWMQDRAPLVAVASWALGLSWLWWSYLELRNKGYWLFDRVRGPATAWVCVGALAQVGFFPWSLSVGDLVRIAIALGLFAAALVYVIRKQVDDDRQRRWEAIGGLIGGIVLVVAWPLLLVLSAGGRSDRSSSDSDVKVG